MLGPLKHIFGRGCAILPQEILKPKTFCHNNAAQWIAHIKNLLLFKQFKANFFLTRIIEVLNIFL